MAWNSGLEYVMAWNSDLENGKKQRPEISAQGPGKRPKPGLE
jgi:hypothetical protein